MEHTAAIDLPAMESKGVTIDDYAFYHVRVTPFSDPHKIRHMRGKGIGNAFCRSINRHGHPIMDESDQVLDPLERFPG